MSCAAGFVALQVADQVEGGAWQIEKLGEFGFEFLDAVFAELAQAGFVGGADYFCWMRFGYGDDGDFVWAASRAGGGLGDAFADLGEVGGDGRGRVGHGGILALWVGLAGMAGIKRFNTENTEKA